MTELTPAQRSELKTNGMVFTEPKITREVKIVKKPETIQVK